MKFSSFIFREETASQKIDLRLRVMARVAEHKAVRSVFTFHFHIRFLICAIQDNVGNVQSEVSTMEE